MWLYDVLLMQYGFSEVPLLLVVAPVLRGAPLHAGHHHLGVEV